MHGRRRSRASCAGCTMLHLHTWRTAPAARLLVLTLAIALDFSQDHSTRFHSGPPPCAAMYLLSGLKATLVTSCVQGTQGAFEHSEAVALVWTCDLLTSRSRAVGHMSAVCIGVWTGLWGVEKRSGSG